MYEVLSTHRRRLIIKGLLLKLLFLNTTVTSLLLILSCLIFFISEIIENFNKTSIVSKYIVKNFTVKRKKNNLTENLNWHTVHNLVVFYKTWICLWQCYKTNNRGEMRSLLEILSQGQSGRDTPIKIFSILYHPVSSKPYIPNTTFSKLPLYYIILLKHNWTILYSNEYIKRNLYFRNFIKFKNEMKKKMFK